MSFIGTPGRPSGFGGAAAVGTPTTPNTPRPQAVFGVTSLTGTPTAVEKDGTYAELAPRGLGRADTGGSLLVNAPKLVGDNGRNIPGLGKPIPYLSFLLADFWIIADKAQSYLKATQKIRNTMLTKSILKQYATVCMVKVGDEEDEGYREELRIENKIAVEVWYTWVLQRQPKAMTLMLPDVREAHLPYFSFQKYLIDLLGRKEKVLIEVSKVYTTIWVKCVKEKLTSIYSICYEISSFCLL
jgi:hypothetical protein